MPKQVLAQASTTKTAFIILSQFNCWKHKKRKNKYFMDYDIIKTKSKPELKTEENIKLQQRDLFWKMDTRTASTLGKNRYNDGGKSQKHGQQLKDMKKIPVSVDYI